MQDGGEQLRPKKNSGRILARTLFFTRLTGTQANSTASLRIHPGESAQTRRLMGKQPQRHASEVPE